MMPSDGEAQLTGGEVPCEPNRGGLLNRRRLFGGAVASFAGVGLYTWRIEPHWLEIVRRVLPIRNLPPSWAGATVAQLSDLHIGPQVDPRYLHGVFDQVKKLSPKIVVYTGDFISYTTDLRRNASSIFAQLPLGTEATFGVLGNHDYGNRWQDTALADEVIALTTAAGVRILRNESVDLDGLKILGMDDLWATQIDVAGTLRTIGPEDPALALVHNPDAADWPGWGRMCGWILSGHTHGGQCKPPFLPPPLLPVRNRRYTSGEFSLDGNRRLYISRGVGHLLRVRFNVRPEVTLFELASSNV
jgi:predicted MPP superfamily phosphohydrolase